MGVFHGDLIKSLSVTVADTDLVSARRKTRIDPHRVAANLHPEDLFEPGSIHPTG
jgi:hypothetical protein